MEDIQKTIDVLKNGGICIFPTDTAYGIGCRMDNAKAVKKIFSIRNRPEEKAVLVLVSDLEMAKKYVEISETIQQRLIEKYWPGALTIIFPCNTEKVPDVVRAQGKTLAVRMPDHIQLRQLISQVGVPIIAPSANFAGEATPLTIEDVDQKLSSLVDFVLRGKCTMKGVSTIIDTSTKSWKIVREGVVKISI